MNCKYDPVSKDWFARSEYFPEGIGRIPWYSARGNTKEEAINNLKIYMENKDLEIIYIPGDSFAFKAFIDEHYKDKTVELVGIDGKNRWVITRPDGTKYIARPESCKK